MQVSQWLPRQEDKRTSEREKKAPHLLSVVHSTYAVCLHRFSLSCALESPEIFFFSFALCSHLPPPKTAREEHLGGRKDSQGSQRKHEPARYAGPVLSYLLTESGLCKKREIPSYPHGASRRSSSSPYHPMSQILLASQTSKRPLTGPSFLSSLSSSLLSVFLSPGWFLPLSPARRAILSV